MLLYQAPIWKKINEEAFENTVWEDSFEGKKVWGLTHDFAKAGVVMRFYQLLGILPPADLKALKQFASKYLRSWKDLFFQYGFVKEVGREKSKILRKFVDDELKKSDLPLYDTKKKVISELATVGAKKSFRENMPEATVEVDLRLDVWKLWEDVSQMTKRQIKKAQKRELDLKPAKTREEVLTYRKLWKKMAEKKWIGIRPLANFEKMMQILWDEGAWELLLAWTGDGKLAYWAVFVFTGKRVNYLYGATNTTYSWAAHWTMWEAIKRYAEQRFEVFDFVWVPSIVATGHQWQDLARFKYSFWGEHVEYRGNFDIVKNALGYMAYAAYFNAKNLASKNKKDGSKSRKKSKG